MQNQTKYLFILITQTSRHPSEGAAQSRTLTTSLLNKTWQNLSPDAVRLLSFVEVNGRGYTAHEMLPQFGLINMNGRLYDPVLGRMLSPDNYIQLPDYTQNFNRYSYVLNNPLKYVDIDGQNPLIIIPIVIGMYLGGVATNQGELNPIQWNWVDEGAWKTYAGIVGGGILGYIGGWYILNPGNLQVAASIITPLGTVGMVGQGSDWSFQWTTNAGGGGSVPIGNNKQQNTNIMVQNQINQSVNVHLNSNKTAMAWNGPYFTGTEEEARQLLVENSILYNSEAALWSTDRGYYFEPIQGYVYDNSYDYRFDELHTSFKRTKYKENAINRSYIYTSIDNSDYYLWLSPNIFQRSRIRYRAHTHPMNSPPSDADKRTIYMLGIEGRVFGWSGIVYFY